MYLHTNSFVHTENVFRSALQNAGKRSDLSATASSGTPALSLFNAEQRMPALAAFSNNNAVFFLDKSDQHFDIGPYKTTFRKHRSHILVATCRPLRCLPYCHIRFISTLSFATDCIVLPTPKLMTFRSPLYHSVVHNLKTFPCQITATTNVMNHFCTRYALLIVHVATYYSYVKRAALYRTFISQSFVRGNNSNDRSLVALAGSSLTRVDTQCVYHPLHEMWS